MKIFITGSTGFVGRNLIEYYKDHEVFEHKRYMDLGAKLEYFKPDLIINCAAEIYDPAEMWIPNVLWTQECLEFVKANPNTRMIQIGSSSEYGPMLRGTAPGKALGIYCSEEQLQVRLLGYTVQRNSSR